MFTEALEFPISEARYNVLDLVESAVTQKGYSELALPDIFATCIESLVVAEIDRFNTKPAKACPLLPTVSSPYTLKKIDVPNIFWGITAL